ncbi:MAG: hypothetical protein ACE5IK_10080 [Acidobacteriota bacterium]
MSVEVKMSHDENQDCSEIRFRLTGEERQLEGVTFGMVFGAGQPPEIRAEFLTNHLKGIVEKAKAAKAKAREEAKQKAAAAAASPPSQPTQT